MSKPTTEQKALLKRAGDEAYAERYMTKMRQRTCAGSKYFIEEKEKNIFKGHRFVVQNTGCRERRRNGSKWCQICSDAHSKV